MARVQATDWVFSTSSDPARLWISTTLLFLLGGATGAGSRPGAGAGRGGRSRRWRLRICTLGMVTGGAVPSLAALLGWAGLYHGSLAEL